MENTEKQILNQLRKQNAIMADILAELKKLNKATDNSSCCESNLMSVLDPDNTPTLLDNEKKLEVCHVVKNHITYTFNKGRVVSIKDATPSDFYMYREEK